MQFHEKLRTLRKRHGLSQQKLGEHIGLSQSFIKDLESGRKRPNTRHLIKMSDLFGVSIDVLVRDELELDNP